mmetsp:Transcript_13946/g.39691  ORF Transcript_13946/g.39691 Transcript_13946/m.39691 type:complete len:354 (+) Transcript_13946:902-1963(+)
MARRSAAATGAASGVGLRPILRFQPPDRPAAGLPALVRTAEGEMAQGTYQHWQLLLLQLGAPVPAQHGAEQRAAQPADHAAVPAVLFQPQPPRPQEQERQLRFRGRDPQGPEARPGGKGEAAARTGQEQAGAGGELRVAHGGAHRHRRAVPGCQQPSVTATAAAAESPTQQSEFVVVGHGVLHLRGSGGTGAHHQPGEHHEASQPPVQMPRAIPAGGCARVPACVVEHAGDERTQQAAVQPVRRAAGIVGDLPVLRTHVAHERQVHGPLARHQRDAHRLVAACAGRVHQERDPGEGQRRVLYEMQPQAVRHQGPAIGHRPVDTRMSLETICVRSLRSVGPVAQARPVPVAFAH